MPATPHTPAPFSVTPAARAHSQEMRIAWILLLLARGSTHGYALARAMDTHGLYADRGALYRTLRKLDDDGWVASEWMASVAGPRRRAYRLTPKGRQILGEMARLVRTTMETHARFLEAYEPLHIVRRGS